MPAVPVQLGVSTVRREPSAVVVDALWEPALHQSVHLNNPYVSTYCVLDASVYVCAR